MQNGLAGIVKVFEDAGISGAKGRDKRPGLDAMMKAVNAKDFDMVTAWSVDRLGRSLTDLLAILQALQEKGVDLFLHQQGIDTSTTAGKATFQMLGVFAEFERGIIRERVNAGLARARAKGVNLYIAHDRSLVIRKHAGQWRKQRSDSGLGIDGWRRHQRGAAGAGLNMGIVTDSLISDVVSADNVPQPNQPSDSSQIASDQSKFVLTHPIDMHLRRAGSRQHPCHLPTTGVLGSNQDSGPDDRYRKDDDHQVDGEPLRYMSHSFGPLRPVLCAERGWADVSQFTRNTKFSSSASPISQIRIIP